jgi:hypothetical protein
MSDDADSLFEALPADFVKARNALVKSLRAAGRRDLAETTSKLARPTASVWATNQVARRAPELIARLAEATARLQGGAPDRERYAAAIQQHRALLNEVRARVEEALAAAGLRAPPPVIAAAVHNFRAGFMDAAARPAIERGRLQSDLGPDPGGPLFGLAGPLPERAPAAAPPPAERAPADDAIERDRPRREEARALAQARAESEARVHARRQAVEAAAAARAEQEAGVAAARRQLEAAERGLAAARAAETAEAAALAEAEAALRALTRRRPDPA